MRKGVGGERLRGNFNVRIENSPPTAQDNFAPDSADRSHGKLVASSNGEASLTLASSTKNSEEHLFKGQQTLCKENDYLLIFEPETQEFVLRKHSSAFALRNIRTAKRKITGTDSADELESSSPLKGTIIMPTNNNGAGKVTPNTSTTVGDEDEDDDDGFSDLESSLLRDLEQS